MRNSKTKKSRQATPAITAAEPQNNPRMWIYATALAIALFAAFEVYWPAIHGPFLLDDTHLTYMLPNAADIPVRRLGAPAPSTVDADVLAELPAIRRSGNVRVSCRKCAAAFLQFDLYLPGGSQGAGWAGVEESRRRILSFFAAGLFLLHPLQTESVSYIASRSETLSVFFVLAALVVFLYRRSSVVSIPRILALLVLFAAAGLSKEHTAVLPALFILTDYYWNFGFSPSVIWRNWKLYVPSRPALLLHWSIFGAFYLETKPRASKWRGSPGTNTSSPSAG